MEYSEREIFAARMVVAVDGDPNNCTHQRALGYLAAQRQQAQRTTVDYAGNLIET